MKIKAQFKTTPAIYRLLKKQAKLEYDNYECDWGSSMYWDEKNPNVFEQTTCGGYSWKLVFQPKNTIEIEYDGVRNSALSTNLVGWQFCHYRPGDFNPVCFKWSFWEGNSPSTVELYGECLTYETSAKWNDKPIGFEGGGMIWGQNEEVIVLIRPHVIPSEEGGFRSPTDEEALRIRGFSDHIILHRDDNDRIYITKRAEGPKVKRGRNRKK